MIAAVFLAAAVMVWKIWRFSRAFHTEPDPVT